MSTNALTRAASPYLRQHQENPVLWVEWSEAAFERARRENKLLLISVGYAACHWCHVMAHESFEDADIAELMNRHYVCIKVDREERPDVDRIYLEAVQLMSGHGGWPLNCFVLPDGRPVFGGTYFRPRQWKDVLMRLQEVWEREPESVAAQAEHLTAHLRKLESRTSDASGNGSVDWKQVYAAFASRFDRVRGGTGSAPKFPMPCEVQFLLRYGWYARDEACLKQVRLTLDRMAAGGIHDQLAGGFARYSTDAEWKVPHFEKMLYDNAQLLELYAEAAAAFAEPAYREVALGIAEFLENELAAPAGGYASALDADSEGEEGRYYAWTRAELEAILGDRYPWFADLCGVEGDGFWEHDKNVLLRRYPLDELAARQGWTSDEARKAWEGARRDLLVARERRIRPMLDDKVLTSWNGLLIRALSSAYRYTGEEFLRQRARRVADFLLTRALRSDGGLWHRQPSETFGAAGVDGFLEDYAFLAEGLIDLYQATFDERYVSAARGLIEYAWIHFNDPVSPMFYFTSDSAPPVLVRKKEMTDNVIPSSNAALAHALLALADFFVEPRYQEKSEAMLAAMRGELSVYGPAYAYWAQIQFLESLPAATFAVVGPEAVAFRDQAGARYMPHLRLAGGEAPSELPLLRGKYQSGLSFAYRCERGTCGLPQQDWRALLAAERTHSGV